MADRGPYGVPDESWPSGTWTLVLTREYVIFGKKIEVYEWIRLGPPHEDW